MSLIKTFAEIVGMKNVLSQPSQLRSYDCDAYTLEKAFPNLVILPGTTEEVARIVKLAVKEKMPFVPRGAGTGLSGGTLTPNGGVVIGLSRMTAILGVDIRNRRIKAQAGAVNFQLSKAALAGNCIFAPDPSSQGACTIGGNVAENSGGPHTLKYGVTVNHITGLEMVLPDGDIANLGGEEDEPFGYDLTGVTVGNEGTFGIVTSVTARLVKKAQAWSTMLAVFDEVEDATNTVSAIIASGTVPAALEMMDKLAIFAVEEAFGYGLPVNAEAILIIELEGLEAGMAAETQKIEQFCFDNKACSVKHAQTTLERAQLWAARKKAAAALGRLAPSCATQDGVIPRSKLSDVLKEANGIAAKYGLRVANLFHAGDGNLHPILLFDDSIEEQRRNVTLAGEEILKLCLSAGGSLTGEHGIGVEKCGLMGLMFNEDDLAAMRLLKDVFNPNDLCNPEKIFPDSRYCYETKLSHRIVNV